MDQIKQLALEIGNIIDDKKGEDIRVLELIGLTSLADYFVIASGNSDRQVSAISTHIEDELAKKGIEPKHKEGMREGRWVILDYSDIIVHIFHQEERDYYQLERIWNDAKNLPIIVESLA